MSTCTGEAGDSLQQGQLMHQERWQIATHLGSRTNEFTRDEVLVGALSDPLAIRFRGGSIGSAPLPSDSSGVTSFPASSSFDDDPSAFFSLSLASSPSTRLSSASSTSVLGPRFLGTASGHHQTLVSGSTLCHLRISGNVRVAKTAGQHGDAGKRAMCASTHAAAFIQTHHKRKGTEKSDRPRMLAVTGCT